MKTFRSALVAVGLFVGAVLGSAIGFGGGVPLIPSSPTFSEPSQIVGTLNAFINQLNGNALGAGGYAAQPNGTPSLGSFCQPAAGATPLTCNGNRGITSFTGVTVAGNADATVVVNNSTITTASACSAQILNNPTAAAGPAVSSVTPTAGVLTIVLTNATATTTGSVTFNIGFNCFV